MLKTSDKCAVSCDGPTTTFVTCTCRKPEEKADPQDGLMTMLKDMYEDGDDEMKKTIAQAWTKSRDKEGAAPDMGL